MNVKIVSSALCALLLRRTLTSDSTSLFPASVAELSTSITGADGAKWRYGVVSAITGGNGAVVPRQPSLSR